MNEEALQQVRREPPERGSVGFFTLLLGVIRAFLARFFAAKHPGDFDVEFGSWIFPDFNLVPGSQHAPPRPLVNRDSDETYLIYNFVSIAAPRCTLAGQLVALGRAMNEVSQFLQNNFRCEDPDCLQEAGELVWVGLDCGPGPADQAGVLVRFRCVPEN